MAGFGRSNSLSINTSGGLFGNQTNQGQQSAGLFGSSTNASQPQQTGGLFGSTPAQQPQTGGLFGGASSQPPQSAGLFGNANKPAGSTGGLFGASTQQPQTAQGGGLFGGPLGGTANTQNQTSQSGGLFGGQSTQAKPSLFGGGASTQQQNSAPSLFGNTNTQQTQPQTTSLFGGMNTQQNNNPLGGGLGGLGQASTLGNSQVNALQMNDLSQLRGTTRFAQLHPELQRQVEEIDKAITDKIEKFNQIRETYPGYVHRLESVAPDVTYVKEKLGTVTLGLENDAFNISELRKIVDKDQADGELAIRAIINQALPTQFRYGNTANLSTSMSKPTTAGAEKDETTTPVDLIKYFNTRTDDLGKTLETYQGQIREIELHLRTMEAGTYEKTQQLMGARNRATDERQQLVEALRAIEAAIMDSAKKVGKVRDDVEKVTIGGAALL